MKVAKILVPTDFSDNAEIAFASAVTMAKAFGASIILAHARQTPLVPLGYAYGAVELPIEMDKDIRKSIDNHLQKARKALGEDLVSDIQVLEGAPSTEICRVAKEQNVDMIVMATHGHSGLAHLLMGSTAERVIRGAPCPVLTVRPAK